MAIHSDLAAFDVTLGYRLAKPAPLLELGQEIHDDRGRVFYSLTQLVNMLLGM